MSDQWTNVEMAEFTHKYIEAQREVGRRMARDINRAFFSFYGLHRSAGRPIPESAQMAIDDMNKAIQRT